MQPGGRYEDFMNENAQYIYVVSIITFFFFLKGEF